MPALASGLEGGTCEKRDGRSPSLFRWLCQQLGEEGADEAVGQDHQDQQRQDIAEVGLERSGHLQTGALVGL